MATRAPLPQGMKEIKLTIPQHIDDLLTAMAARLPSSKQGLLAPLIHAFAKGELRQEYFLPPDAHGNAGSKKLK